MLPAEWTAAAAASPGRAASLSDCRPAALLPAATGRPAAPAFGCDVSLADASDTPALVELAPAYDAPPDLTAGAAAATLRAFLRGGGASGNGFASRPFSA